jgi:hypothetical protein
MYIPNVPVANPIDSIFDAAWKVADDTRDCLKKCFSLIFQMLVLEYRGAVPDSFNFFALVFLFSTSVTC